MVEPGRHPATPADVVRAGAIVAAGGLVAFPTETVYGLGASAADAEAVRRLYRVKGRPADHPVIVHVAHASALDTVAVEVSPAARALADALWPGPLTLVVSRRPGAVVDEVTGGRSTVAVRVPRHPVALAFLEAAGVGVAAPSANRFGRVSPTTAADVVADLGTDVDMVLDGGPCAVGVESTIVDCTVDPPRVLRHGGVPDEAVVAVVGRVGVPRTDGEVAAPGTLAAHYAPRTPVELVDDRRLGRRLAALSSAGLVVGVLAPAGVSTPSGVPAVRLATPDTVEDYARELYVALRRADAAGVDRILAVPPPAVGIGVAVADRLRRAAAAGG